MRAAGTLTALLALSVAACQGLSERECRAGDWKSIGAADGARGEAPGIGKHREACAAHGVAPDAAAYDSGYAAGLERYCTPAGGYRSGRDGELYRRACKGAAERDFFAAYQHGKRVYELRVELAELQRRAEDSQYAAMMDEDPSAQRTDMRFRAEEWRRRADMKRWDLERLDRKYAQDYGVPELSWTELRQRY